MQSCPDCGPGGSKDREIQGLRIERAIMLEMLGDSLKCPEYCASIEGCKPYDNEMCWETWVSMKKNAVLAEMYEKSRENGVI